MKAIMKKEAEEKENQGIKYQVGILFMLIILGFIEFGFYLYRSER